MLSNILDSEWDHLLKPFLLKRLSLYLKEIEEIQAVQPTGDDAMDACTWSQEDEDSYSWNTSCGHLFRLDEGSPEDNGMKFCCYCGGTVTSEHWVDEDAAITPTPTTPEEKS